ncbi:MAG: hypothetical protein AAFX51_06540 [Cyanobacteria bacterium J06636_28]
MPVIVCANGGSTHSSADAWLCSPYTAEDIFANVQALRPLTSALSDSVVTSAWIDS